MDVSMYVRMYTYIIASRKSLIVSHHSHRSESHRRESHRSESHRSEGSALWTLLTHLAMALRANKSGNINSPHSDPLSRKGFLYPSKHVQTQVISCKA